MISLLEPLSKVVPTVAKNSGKTSLNQRIVYTGMGLFVYLICSQIPLYGIKRSTVTDPLYWARVILASNRGTLMELGISPIITAAWILQIFGAMGYIKTNTPKEEHILEGFEKTFALILCFGEAVGQLCYGAYGNPSELEIIQILLLIAQLMFTGFCVILLDQLLKKYGLGSGISLFILVNTSEEIFWSLFSPVTLSSEYGIEFEGSFICLVHFFLTKSNKWSAIAQAFTRQSNPNLLSLFGTILIFFLVVYLQSFQVKIPLINQHHRGYTTNIPIKLFYTSNMSVILQSTFVSHFHVFSKILSRRFNKSLLLNLLGRWEGRKIVGGLLWYISPPNGIEDVVDHPFRAITYVVFMCAICAFFSRLWIEVSKENARSIAKRIRSEDLTLPNYEEASVYGKLKYYIPTAAMLGGIMIGLLTILGDMVNAIGSSTGILLSTSIIYRYCEKIGKN